MTSLTESDIEEYWTTLFPEMDNKYKIKKVIECVTLHPLCDLTESYINNKDEIKSNLIDDIFSSPEYRDMSKYNECLRKRVPLCDFYMPIVNYFLNKEADKINSLNITSNFDTFMKDALFGLLMRLSKISGRCLVLFINVARINGTLKGESPEERYCYFKDIKLKDRAYLKSLYKQFMELSRVMYICAKQYFSYVYEILRNIKDEGSAISTALNGGKELGRIALLKIGLGDTHSGKSVALIQFAAGLKLIYKPRNMSLEIGYVKLIDWINGQSDPRIEKMKAVKSISFSDHGFSEYINYKECLNEKEVEKFYRLSGQNMALLYSLNAVDFHFENIIAHGCYPVLADLETLFHPRIVNSSDEYASVKLANEIIDRSVLSVGMLPHYWDDDSGDNYRLDVSGLGITQNKKSPFRMPTPENLGSDEIRVKLDYEWIAEQKNNPEIDGKPISVEMYKEYVRQGFKMFYSFILDNKSSFVQKINEYFGDVQIRVIMRPTMQYSRLFQTSLHPDFMQNKVNRMVILSRIGINTKWKSDAVLHAELVSLMNADIPYFYVDSNSTELYCDKKMVSDELISRAPMDMVLRKIKNFSADDLALQMKFIDMSFCTYESGREKDVTNITFSTGTFRERADKKSWLSMAVDIGEYILANSIVDKNYGSRTWVSCVLTGGNESVTQIAPVGDDMYNGNSGIAFFLICLYMASQKTEFLEAAAEAMSSSIQFIKQALIEFPYSIGFFNGISGNMYVLYLLYKITKQEKYVDYIKKYLILIDNIVYGDTRFDVIGGSAGCIFALCQIYRSCQDSSFKKRLMHTLDKCCRYLIDKSIKNNGAVTWDTSAGHHYTGFSHGNAGIAAAIAEASGILKNADTKDLIGDAVRFENNQYCKQAENWFIDDNREKIGFGWCHGAPGILLGDIILKKHGYCNLDSYINAALKTTVTHSFGNSPGICHGDLGNLLILQYCADVLNDENLKSGCLNTFEECVKNVISPRCKGKAFRGTESMGLMVGSAGFGYSLLKFSNPDLIPSIVSIG